jgi:hypothetical protein
MIGDDVIPQLFVLTQFHTHQVNCLEVSSLEKHTLLELNPGTEKKLLSLSTGTGNFNFHFAQKPETPFFRKAKTLFCMLESKHKNKQAKNF